MTLRGTALATFALLSATTLELLATVLAVVIGSVAVPTVLAYLGCRQVWQRLNAYENQHAEGTGEPVLSTARLVLRSVAITRRASGDFESWLDLLVRWVLLYLPTVAAALVVWIEITGPARLNQHSGECLAAAFLFYDLILAAPKELLDSSKWRSRARVTLWFVDVAAIPWGDVELSYGKVSLSGAIGGGMAILGSLDILLAVHILVVEAPQ